MIYYPLLDICFLSYAPIMERNAHSGLAVIDPPIRPGGYRVGDDTDEGDRLYRLLFRRACDVDRRRPPRY